jgi:flagellar assembly protein FliH
MPSSDKNKPSLQAMPWLQALKASVQPLPPRPDTRRIINSVPPPEGDRVVSYARFIPREELGEVRPWTPRTFGQTAAVPAQGGGAANSTGKAPPPEEPTPAQWRARIEQAREEARREARQQAYEEGYRDGLAALEGFKTGHVQEVSARLGDLVRHFDTQLYSLEAEMANALAGTAVRLARQVVRQELQTRPEHVVGVAREAVQAVLMSARQIVVRVHPDDLELVRAGAAEALQARGARLLADGQVHRGGCRVDSDAGSIDADIGTRWAEAAAAVGHPVPYVSGDGEVASLTPAAGAR